MSPQYEALFVAPIRSDTPSPPAIVEELLTRDLVVLDRLDTDLFERDPLTAGFGCDVEGKVDGEPVGVVEERIAALNSFAHKQQLGFGVAYGFW